jgi:hypothetical protein
MIGLAFKAFAATGLVTKLIAVGVLLASMGIGYGVWHHKVYQRGVDDTIAKIARADAKTIAKATEARGVLKSCQARGLGWDQTTGQCK